MKRRWMENEITHAAAALIAMGLLLATPACSRNVYFSASKATPLPPVDAPLAPAKPGARFAPDAPVSDFVFDDNDKERRKRAVSETLPPRSIGTHVTASLVRRDGSRLVAVWGDPVLWTRRRGAEWRPAPYIPLLTGRKAEVIALGEDKESGKIVIGTRREGGFIAQSGVWRAVPRPNSPYDANAQALAAYRGTLFVATLNDGLVLRDPNGVWSHVAPPVIGSNAPRQFLTWRDDLYVRHGDGTVDRFDGRAWTRDIFTRSAPRRQVSAMATDGETLFLAQWGGWSETRDRQSFTHHFPADLSNLPVTALLPVKNGLLVGTQGRGLAECDRETGAVRRWHDERQGIEDDWITALAQSPTGRIVAGTFVGGAFWTETDAAGSVKQPWRAVSATQSDCVTGIVATTPDTVFVSLRRGGVQRLEKEGSVSAACAFPEAQCLLVDEGNGLLWVGARTGISTVSGLP